MQTAVVLAIVLPCAAYLVWRMLGKAGIGKAGGKPDCGCGSCDAKRRGRRA
ncbi:MAG: FeoB-associated Cys-rich membrane protein [Armatimonadetes bacterium]|nr:FeoB-associated Cys-rich membrane protein [Armatimonadota bacterium]